MKQENVANFYEQRTIEWDEASESVKMIDQTLLPNTFRFIHCRSVAEIVEAIKSMRVRGAPAIGVAGAMGIAVSVLTFEGSTKKELVEHVLKDAAKIKVSRPTAINLSWGVDQVLNFLRYDLSEKTALTDVRREIVGFVKQLAEEDVQANRKLSDIGATLFRDGDTVLTHCK